jgi:hypothetical protein
MRVKENIYDSNRHEMKAGILRSKDIIILSFISEINAEIGYLPWYSR